LLGLEKATDRVLWQYAETNGYTLVSFDSDFAELAVFLGAPPKVIWLRSGNQSTASVERILREHAAAITDFETGAAACLEIYQPIGGRTTALMTAV
jgi:predicted nuclease of predicted toxin-antitoxin system